MNKNLQSTTSQFIEKAIKINGNKFDYSKVEYVGSHTKVCIICPEHGEFYQSPTNHLWCEIGPPTLATAIQADIFFANIRLVRYPLFSIFLRCQVFPFWSHAGKPQKQTTLVDPAGLGSNFLLYDLICILVDRATLSLSRASCRTEK
jgi:hypothetical protein